MQLIKNRGMKFWMIVTSFAILLIAICTFAYMNTRGVLVGVKINAEIKNSEDKLFSTVSGVAKNSVVLTLNGREILIDKNGTFNEAIALPDGYSVVTIEATDQFGKNSKKAFEVYTVDSQSVAVGDMNRNLINN